jgi:hypothetical protein
MPERKPRPATDRYERAIRSLIDDLARADARQPHLSRAAIADRLAKAAERLTRLEVDAARSLDGASWQEVGDAFGIIRQSAHERFHAGPDGPHRRPARVVSTR